MQNIKENWDLMAQAYEEFNTAADSYSYSIEWPLIKTLLPELSGKAVLDLGCGTGIFTFLLEERSPAKLVGMDISDGMLAIARQKAAERHSSAEFIQGDASDLSRVVSEKFDLIFSSTTTHYIRDLGAFFRGVENCLAADGTVILSVINPVYSAQYPPEHGETFPDDDEWNVRYLDRSIRAYIQPWIEYNDEYENSLSRSYHHLFSDYVNAISAAGLRIQEMHEPLPPGEWKTDSPGRYAGYIETPVYLIMKLTR